jgi:hypothetical protein
MFSKTFFKYCLLFWPNKCNHKSFISIYKNTTTVTFIIHGFLDLNLSFILFSTQYAIFEFVSLKVFVRFRIYQKTHKFDTLHLLFPILRPVSVSHFVKSTRNVMHVESINYCNLFHYILCFCCSFIVISKIWTLTAYSYSYLVFFWIFWNIMEDHVFYVSLRNIPNSTLLSKTSNQKNLLHWRIRLLNHFSHSAVNYRYLWVSVAL